jgi:endonuclease I
LKVADADPNNANNVILIYTRESVNGQQEYDGWNREHVWAKSRGDFGISRPMGTDVHNLRASNINVNSTRSNYSFENCTSNSCEQTYGNSYSSSALVFEPRDEDKGDVARIIFYMVVRYEGDSGEEDLEMTESILSVSSKSPRHGVRSTLLEWHELDPVDDFERNRNDVIYSYQGNRNPFIDHPEIVDFLWGDQQQTSWNSSLSNPAQLVDRELFIPNPVQTSYVDIPSSIDVNTISLYNIQGRQMSLSPGSADRIKMPTTSGIYFLQFVFGQSLVNKRILVKTP